MKPLPSFTLEIPKRSRHCNRCSLPLSPGAIYHSIIFEREAGLCREDHCAHCWDESNLKITTDSIKSYWKSTVHQQIKKVYNPQEKLETALLLLQQYSAAPCSTNEEEAFILALYLARAKWIKLCGEMRLDHNQIGMLFEVYETGEMLCVKKIALNTLPLATLQKKIALQLSEIP